MVMLLACQDDSYNIVCFKDVNSEYQSLKISRDIDVLSPSDAVKVAKMSMFGYDCTKSSNKDVLNAVPIEDAKGNILMYAVNFNDGYIIVSATKKYYPILALIDKGTYTGAKSDNGQDIILRELIEIVNAAIDGKVSLDDNSWSYYEKNIFPEALQTKVSDSYIDVVNEYTGEWYMDGYNIYYLNQKPENMPDDLYNEFCEIASEFDRYDHNYMECSFIVENIYETTEVIGPFCTTTWHQRAPYNVGLGADYPLGCTTIAAAQIMRYLQYPTSYSWANMSSTLPINQVDTVLTNFLAQLRNNIGVDSGGAANLTETKHALANHYGFNKKGKYSVEIKNHNISDVTSSLLNNLPIFMAGRDKADDGAHVWVCDGRRYSRTNTEYYLYVIPTWEDEITSLYNVETRTLLSNEFFMYHMNMGGESVSANGYYLDYRISVPSDNLEYNFDEKRKDIVITINEDDED